jgi:hypothetical protein
MEGGEEGHGCCSPVGEEGSVRRRREKEREMRNYLHAAVGDLPPDPRRE